ncbi:MAG: orotidine-5'-phosphate decarboxylase [Verrucomicrobia bacterium]|jgi:orotidine-5'-phosphate decarboxylase|nr:orotidine-5'-phosphate decarboxylase [Verrucomicrobiota bacterium]MBV8532740.1 orotidine-5'-phosphate decarboxylase [Verrucomicrobiota bacterium]
MHRHPVQSSIAAKDKIIVPLDVPAKSAARELIKAIGGKVGFFKVGDQLFIAAGPAIVEEIQASGARVFLDLKFHDIPNTVRRAVESACALGVDMLTIHLSGGREMCEAAVVGRGISKILILGVTVLTSLSDEALAEVGFRTSVQDEVLLLADLAKHVGITGLVASPQELVALRERFGSLFTMVIPGIRPTWSEAGDQKRTLTPRQAVDAGADYLVIGRPITASPDPQSAVQRIIDELES